MRCVKDNATGNVLYRFEGPVSYIVYDEGESGDKGNIQRMNLFNIVRNTDGTIKVTYNGIGNNYTLQGYREKGSTEKFNTEITIEYGKDYEGNSSAALINANTLYLTNFYFRLDKDTDGIETLTVHFSDDIFAIPGGGNSELRLSVTRNDKTNVTAGQFRNDVQLIPNPEVPTNAELINYDRVASSEKVMESGKVIGVASSSAFVVINGYATTSIKAVTELDSNGERTSNTTSSDKTNNVITLKSAESKFEYKSSVHLPKETETKSLVIIDTLPKIDDSSVFQEDDLRGSQFNVNFTDDIPVVKVEYTDGTTKTLTLETDYTIDYSEKTNQFTDDDWQGISAFDTDCDPSIHRAIRVNITKVLPADSIVNLYYRAVADTPSDVEDGEIAYSSFGYSYQVNVASFARQQAAPLKVGVRAPNTVYLFKKLSERDGSDYKAKQNETVKFILYKGESLNLTGSNKAELAEKLGSREFTVATLTVPEGSSESEKVALSSGGLKLCSYSPDNDEFVESTSDWELTSNEKYTVYEYEYNNNYFFKAFGRDESQNFTFTYNPAISQSIECENVLSTWQVSIVKKDYDNEDIRLEGAVFGLYSTDVADEISDDDLETAINDLGITNQLSKIETVTINNVEATVYLKHISATDELGVVSWNDLINSQYAVKELQAPKGYIVNENDGEPNLRLINKPENISLESYTSVATYRNKIYYNLPEAGGKGRTPFYAIGALLIAFSMIFYIYSKQHKYENE